MAFETGMTPGEMATQTGVSLDTLRYYEREGLITEVVRTASGHRRYFAADIEWVDILRCLRLTGMSIQQMKAFATLVQDGEGTEAERLALLTEHRREVTERIAELHAAIDTIDAKTNKYRQLLSERDES